MYIVFALFIIYKIIVILNISSLDNDARDKYLFLYAFEDTIDYKIKVLNDNVAKYNKNNEEELIGKQMV